MIPGGENGINQDEAFEKAEGVVYFWRGKNTGFTKEATHRFMIRTASEMKFDHTFQGFFYVALGSRHGLSIIEAFLGNSDGLYSILFSVC